LVRENEWEKIKQKPRLPLLDEPYVNGLNEVAETVNL
jgi:hypothetical protein